MRGTRLAALLLAGAAAPVPALHAQVRGDTTHAHHPAPDTARAGGMRAPRDTSARRDTSRAMPGMQMPGMPGMAMPGMAMPGDTNPRDLARAGMHDAMSGRRHAAMRMDMVMSPLGGGWMLLGMAQAFVMTTWAAPRDPSNALHATESYLTQPALMANVEGPGSRVVLRTTLNLEALTQPAGEITFGGWGEGFIDRRHPHTFLHEAMLSLNLWRAAGGAFSLSAGKGFAPYGTDDPMSRPVAKYPTNHHLSQILERWTLNGIWLRGPWSLEAGVFGGQEPDGPWSLSNLSSFGNSFSGRVTRRFGGAGTTAPWELSASFGSVGESLEGTTQRTSLWNVAVRHSGSHSFGGIYALAEASLSDPSGEPGYASVLGETQVRIARHRPYTRVELATRPEYAREGAPGTPGFFRYDHATEPIGATRWAIGTLGYEYDLSGGGVATRPFIEVQRSDVHSQRGGVDPAALYGSSGFWTVSAGFRLFFGGGPMRMGTYGVLDDMTLMHHPLQPMAGMDVGQPAHR
jgi:hypothetical protein